MQSKQMLEAIVQAIFSKKGLNVLALDIKHLTPMSDYIVLAEGNVDRHIEAIKNGIIDDMRKIKEKPIYVEGNGKSGWINQVMKFDFRPDALFCGEPNRYQMI